MAWLSPAYPVGAFSYSSGIEWAVESGDITDAASFRRWLDVVIASGSAFCDAVLFVHAHRAVEGRRRQTRCARSPSSPLPSCPRRSVISKRPRRAAPSSRRRAPHGHARRSIVSLRRGTGRSPIRSPSVSRLPATGSRSSPRSPPTCTPSPRTSSRRACASFRLGRPTGSACWRRWSRRSLPPPLARSTTPLDQIGGAAFRADIASMRHETQYTRLFRS